MHTEPLFRTGSRKRKLEELDVFMNKTKRHSYVQRKRGTTVIKNSKWEYILLKNKIFSSAAGFIRCYCQLIVPVTRHSYKRNPSPSAHTDLLRYQKVNKMSKQQNTLFPLESSLPQASLSVEKEETPQIMSLGIQFTCLNFFSFLVCFSTLQNSIQILLHVLCYERKINTLK